MKDEDGEVLGVSGPGEVDANGAALRRHDDALTAAARAETFREDLSLLFDDERPRTAADVDGRRRRLRARSVDDELELNALAERGVNRPGTVRAAGAVVRHGEAGDEARLGVEARRFVVATRILFIVGHCVDTETMRVAGKL